MTIFGIGLLLMATGGFSLGAILLVEAVWGVRWVWTTTHPEILTPVGAILAAVGFFFWASSALEIRKAYNERRLLTRGVYAWSRNPMYAAFIVFLIPALSLLSNNVLISLASLVLYVVFRVSIRKEEEYLMQLFGDGYRRYAEQVPRLIPFRRRFGRK